MPCVDGYLCKLPDVALGPAEGHGCRGGCGGRLHGICGEGQDPGDDNEMYRICSSCATKKAQTCLPLLNLPRRKEAEGGFLPPPAEEETLPPRLQWRR